MDSDDTGIASEAFNYYKVLCIQGYLAVRKHAERIIMLVEMMSASGCPCFKAGPRVLNNLRKRFNLGATEEQCVEIMLSMISDSMDAAHATVRLLPARPQRDLMRQQGRETPERSFCKIEAHSWFTRGAIPLPTADHGGGLITFLLADDQPRVDVADLRFLPRKSQPFHTQSAVVFEMRGSARSGLRHNAAATRVSDRRAIGTRRVFARRTGDSGTSSSRN